MEDYCIKEWKKLEACKNLKQVLTTILDIPTEKGAWCWYEKDGKLVVMRQWEETDERGCVSLKTATQTLWDVKLLKDDYTRCGWIKDLRTTRSFTAGSKYIYTECYGEVLPLSSSKRATTLKTVAAATINDLYRIKAEIVLGRRHCDGLLHYIINDKKGKPKFEVFGDTVSDLKRAIKAGTKWIEMYCKDDK